MRRETDVEGKRREDEKKGYREWSRRVEVVRGR